MQTTISRGGSNRSGKISRPLTKLSTLFAALLLSLILVTSVAAQAPIVSTQAGEVPTTGALRPGPVGTVPAATPTTAGTIPKSIQIKNADVNAQVEINQIINGVMQDPTGPWVISWYKETAKLGQIGNIVLAGHVDYWDVGPAVLYHVKDLKQGDKINVTGADGKVYTYAVQWNKLYQADNAPLQEIVGPTKDQSLTLITCGGTFDYDTGHYLERRVIRATRVAS